MPVWNFIELLDPEHERQGPLKCILEQLWQPVVPLVFETEGPFWPRADDE